MRVLVVNLILFTPNNGVIPKVSSIKDTMIYNLCKGFKMNGHDVVLYSVDDYKPIVDENYDFDIVWDKSKWTKLFRVDKIPYPRNLSEYLKNNSFDRIISSEMLSAGSAICALNNRNNNVTIWHELALHVSFMHKIPSKIWYKLFAPHLFSRVKIIPRSKDAASFLAQFNLPKCMKPVEHGISLNNFPYMHEVKNQFVVVSQLIERKRIDRIIEKFNEFNNRSEVEYKLYIIGNGDLLDTLKKRVDKLGITNNVIFSGRLSHSELQPILASSKALLIDTIQDNNMVSIPESVASGVPVITNSVPTNSSYIRDNNLGIVNDEWDYSDLIEVSSSDTYRQNCIKYRDKLSNEYIASELVK